jgi:hypothetical protein
MIAQIEGLSFCLIQSGFDEGQRRRMSATGDQMVAWWFLMVFRRKRRGKFVAHQVISDKKGVDANDVAAHQ